MILIQLVIKLVLPIFQFFLIMIKNIIKHGLQKKQTRKLHVNK